MPEEIWLAAFQREAWLRQCGERIEQKRQKDLASDLAWDVVVICLLVGLAVWMRGI